MNKVLKLINHLYRGNLLRRIEFERVKNKSKKNQEIWEKASNKDFIFEEQKLFDQFTLRLYKDSDLSKNLFRGDFEFQEIKFLSEFLVKDDVFIDVGANIGYFSIPASKFVGLNGFVYSFEPTEKTFERLQESIQINNCKNIIPCPIALSNKTEIRDFVISNDGFDAYNSLGSPSQGGNFSTKEIETETFDNYLIKENIPDPTLIKIDVEGWEIPVIEGMAKTLSSENSPVLMVEFTEDNAKLSGFSCSDLFKLIESYGYQLYKYNWVRNELIKQENRAHFHYTNLIAIKDKSIIKNRLKKVVFD